MRAMVLCSESTRAPGNPPRPHGLVDFQSAIERTSSIQLDIRLAIGLKDFPNLVRQTRADAVCLLLHWDQPIAELTDVVSNIAQLPSRPRLILLDQVDQTCSPFFGLFKHVDLVLKSQILRDANRYVQSSPSGYVFADYLAENLGYKLGDWHFGERAIPRIC